MSGPCRRWRPAPVEDEGRARAQVVTILADRFPQVERADIEERVAGAWADLAEAPVRDFVPVLATRAVDEQLRHE